VYSRTDGRSHRMKLIGAQNVIVDRDVLPDWRIQFEDCKDIFTFLDQVSMRAKRTGEFAVHFIFQSSLGRNRQIVYMDERHIVDAIREDFDDESRDCIQILMFLGGKLGVSYVSSNR